VRTATHIGSRLVKASLLTALGVLISPAWPASAAAAGDTAALDTDTVQEVTVTANKLTPQKVLDVPASIQAISAEDLQREGAASFMDIEGQIPGLSVQDLGPGDRKYVIRGINSTGDSTAGIYYGEAVISGTNGDDGGGFQSDIRLYDLDHIEVLRGPQGTLYGASSMSGTIRFVPHAPDMNDMDGYLTMEGSDTQHTETGNYNFNGAINLPIIAGTLSLRMVGWEAYDAGYINQIRLGTLGLARGVNDDDVDGGRAILRYQATESLTVDLTYTTQDETSDGSSRYTPAGVEAFSGGPIAPVEGCDLCNTDVTRSPWSDDLQVFGATLNYQTGAGTLTATSNQYDRKTGFEFDSTPILVSYGVPVPAETLEPRSRDVNSSEVRYASDLSWPVNFVAGAYREYDTQDLAVQVITTNAFGVPSGPFSSLNSEDALNYPGVGDTFFGRTDQRTTTEYAGFGELTWKMTSRWTAVAGLRYFTETLNGVQVQTHPFGGFPPGPTLVPLYDPTETFDKVTWKGNLSYKASDSLLGYATVSTGFRGGGLNAVSEPFEPIPASYAPDSLINYEVGAKGRLLGDRLEYQADVYFIRWDNMQVQETTPDGAFVYQGNAGTAYVKGAELELTARPLPHLDVSLAGSYQDAYLEQGASAEQVLLNPTLGVTGEGIPNVPKVQLSLGTSYTPPLTAHAAGILGLDVTYRDAETAYFASNPFNVDLAPYTLINVRAGITTGPWQVVAFARNLGNDRAQISAINSTQDPHALLTVQPRTIGLRVTRKF
jgi:iron complex outermembrane recepter protein